MDPALVWSPEQAAAWSTPAASACLLVYTFLRPVILNAILTIGLLLLPRRYAATATFCLTWACPRASMHTRERQQAEEVLEQGTARLLGWQE